MTRQTCITIITAYKWVIVNLPVLTNAYLPKNACQIFTCLNYYQGCSGHLLWKWYLEIQTDKFQEIHRTILRKIQLSYIIVTFKLTISVRTLPIFFNLHLPITSLILWNQLNFDLLAYFLKWVSVFDLRFGHWDYSLKQLVNLHHLCPIYWRHKSGTLYYCILNFSTLFSVIMEILIFWKHLTKPFVCCYWQN